MRQFYLFFAVCSALSGNGQDMDLDLTFGTNGVVTTNYFFAPKSGFFENNQYYLLGGYGDFTRYNYNGTLDSSFGNAGFQTLSVPNNTLTLRDMKPNNGAIYAYGTLRPNGTPSQPTNGIVVKLQSNGQLDPTFGQNGMAIFDLGTSEAINDIAFNDDGSFYAFANKTQLTQYDDQLVVCKFLPNGTLDTQFNSIGYKIFDYPSQLTAVGIYPSDGQFILASHKDSADFSKIIIVLMKMDASGNLSPNFGNNGEIQISIQKNGSKSVYKMQFVNNKIYCHFYWGFSAFQQGSLLHVYDISAPSALVGSCPMNDDSYFSVLDSGKFMISKGTDYSYEINRKNLDGTTDITFDNDGSFLYDFALPTVSEGASFFYQHEDGSILITGKANNRLNMLRISNSTLSTADVNGESSFSVYPNPASQQLHLKGTENLIVEKISITDISGKTIPVDSFNGHSIDISKLQRGVYFLNVIAEEKSYTLKFIKS